MENGFWTEKNIQTVGNTIVGIAIILAVYKFKRASISVRP
jgi:hypothetical protein